MLKVKFKETVNEMVNSIKDKAKLEEVSLKGITRQNFNEFLDDLFNDGGIARCEEFCDIAMGYSVQFGKFDEPKFDTAQWKCIEAALKELERNPE